MLTVYGIETYKTPSHFTSLKNMLQQCLPFTVLKLDIAILFNGSVIVATVLTVYGIETQIR